MTAEIGVLNTHGVALAADSAVTIGSSKVFNTADKLFSLSKCHPIGIMIYGNATFMGVPWETVIKVYRNKIGESTFDHLAEYCDHFFEYLISDIRLYNIEYEEALINKKFTKFLDELLDSINRTIPEIFKVDPSPEQVRNIIFAEVSHYEEKYKNDYETVPGFDDDYYQKFETEFLDLISQSVNDRINLPVDVETLNKFLSIAASLVIKDIYLNETGIVFAGFGDDEIFPRLKSYVIEGIFNGVLKYKGVHDIEIDAMKQATIVPFAQQEMVHSFITGIDPELKNQIVGSLEKAIQAYPKIINDHIVALDETQESLVHDFGKNILEQFVSHINDTIGEKYSNPVINTVASFPKEELAAMAEALINLTSIKRKMSLQTETVGGPIDVAVISKGDGFIWIKRKNYFSPELNYSNFTN